MRHELVLEQLFELSQHVLAIARRDSQVNLHVEVRDPALLCGLSQSPMAIITGYTSETLTRGPFRSLATSASQIS